MDFCPDHPTKRMKDVNGADIELPSGLFMTEPNPMIVTKTDSRTKEVLERVCKEPADCGIFVNT